MIKKTFTVAMALGLTAGTVLAQSTGTGSSTGAGSGSGTGTGSGASGTQNPSRGTGAGAAGSQGTGSQGTGRSSGTGTGLGAGTSGTQGTGVGLDGTNRAQEGQSTAGTTGAAGSQRDRGTTLGTPGAAGSEAGLRGAGTRAGQPAGAFNDALFAAAAAAGGMAEVGSSRIALDRASSDEVKQFAQRMIQDHTKANRELMGLASQRQMSIPQSLDIKDQADANILSNLTGSEFDRAYIKQQLAAHLCAVNQFTAESQSGRDPEIKAWAAKTLPDLKSHLQMVKRMAQPYEKEDSQ